MNINCPILTTNNQPLPTEVLLVDAAGRPVTNTTFGIPLGTVGNSSTGELAVKVIVVDQRGPGQDAIVAAVESIAGGSQLPYNADEQVITYVVAGPATITYKKDGSTVMVRTFTYENSGASTTDRPLTVVDA